MGKLQTIICRLCLQKCVDFNAVEDYMKEVLDIILLKINLAVSEEPIMCPNCAAMLMRCFDFKATCFYAHDCIVPFLDNEKISKLDLRKVFMSQHENVDIPDDHHVCGFCMELAKKYASLSLDKEEGDFMLNKLIEKYLPELDFSTLEEPMICAPCYESLKTCFHFVTNCLIVEEKVMEFRKLTGADVIEIADVLQSTSRNVSGVENGDTIDVISTEEKFCVDSGNADEQVGDFVHNEERKYLLNEDIEIKTDQSEFDRFQAPFIENKNPSETKMFKCEMCSYETRQKGHLNTHLLTHRSPSEIKMFKCALCSYEARQKSHLKAHSLTHRSPSEVKMFQCEFCSYRTKQRSGLTKHLLTHKNPWEIKMFKCELCSYQAKRKCDLESHLLTHKNPSEIKMFKCAWCSYEAKLKGLLRRHLLTHKTPSEVEMFKCEMCSYEAKEKRCLQSHLLIHKSPSELKMFKCEICAYESKRKSDLRSHLLRHKSPSEIKMFKCEICSYEAKHKSGLKYHLFNHKSPR